MADRPAGQSNVTLTPAEIRRVHRRYFEPLKCVARVHGYNLVTHGSLARDIDLLAIPWIVDAVAPLSLVAALRRVIVTLNAETPRIFCDDFHWEGLWTLQRRPHAKPHGRLAWSFWLTAGTYIDLSVMPKRPYIHDDLLRMSDKV